MQIAKIAHPTDFSAASNNALAAAALIARQAGSKIMLAHAYVKPYLTEAYQGALRAVVDKDLDKEIHEAITAEVEKLATSDLLKGIPMSRKLFQDINPADIVEHLDEDTQLVVVGADDRTGLLGVLFGTLTERIMRRSPVPVLVVPERVMVNRFKKVLLATDFQSPLDSFLPFVKYLAGLFEGEIVIVHINTAYNFATSAFAHEQFESLRAAHPYPNMRLLVHNDTDVAYAVQHLRKAENADLVAMLTQGRTGIAALLQSSIAEELSSTLNVPLLSFRG
ncbi:MAG: universal stress protein [Bacteroidia bacterium]|nr:universal stress protein [Bacteroidia bacterium]